MTWSIDESSARQVCADTDVASESLDNVAFAISDAFGAATVSIGSNTFAAMQEVAADPFLIRIASMRRMVNHVTDLVDTVITIYAEGNLEMAAETQRDMIGLEL